MIPDHLKSQRQLTEQLAQASRNVSDRIAQACSDQLRAEAAYEARLEAIEADEAAELDRHKHALIALQSARDNAWNDCQTVAHDAHRRLRAATLELAGGSRPSPLAGEGGARSAPDEGPWPVARMAAE
jgi:hypothetical protein